MITEKELAENTGTIANPSDVTSIPSPSSGATQTSAPAAGGSEDASPDDDSADEDVPEDVPDDVAADASLEEKLRTFESMKVGYFEQVKEIDQEIQKNNGRQAEIQEELVSTGGTGLPTAPQADMTPRNPADIPALRSEQQQLRDQNQALEAQKQRLKDDLIRKGRSAGIPPGYLRF